MQRFRRVIWFGSFAVVGVVVAAGSWYATAAPRDDAQADEKDDDEAQLAKFMRQKLSASEQILEGLVMEDYELIGEGSDTLLKLSNEEKWRISNDALYRQHSFVFRRVAKNLKKAADEKNLDRASTEWVEATMNCIECHKYVRGMLIAERVGEPTGDSLSRR